ncbi:MAG: cellulose biosynthesis protein BcsE [Pseudomonadota bacterium]
MSHPEGALRLIHTSLSIHGLLDQQIALRAGGVYWVTVDQPSDARLLARQYLEAMPERVPAALICCAGSVQHIISDLAPDRGPDRLKLFEIAQAVTEPGLATLTRDLARAGIAPGSQILLFVPSNSWPNKTTAKHLQQWCERLRPWLLAHQATLLVIAHGEATLLHTQLLRLNETLSGLSRLYRHNGDIRYQLHFWHNDMGVTSGQEFKLSIQGKSLTLIPETAIDTQPRVADDQHVYLAERAVLEGAPSLSKHWYLFENRQALLEEAQTARAATIIVGIDNSHQLLDLAQQLHDLREKCGPALKIVVREMEPAVRYRDERLLLACGANLIVPDNTLLSRFLSLIESVQGQRWQYTQNSDFETLLERQRPPQIRGLVSPRVFFETVEQVYSDSSGEVTHQLIKFQPVAGLDEELFLNQMCLRRYGDIACLLNGELYLFLFACRADGLDPALGNICRLPWRDMFNQRQVLSGIADLSEDAFMQAGPVAANLHIPVESFVTAPSGANSRTPLMPQRISLPISISEPQP